MIVYVESNFLLELALQQEQAGDAEHLLKFAEHGKISLAVPEMGLWEPFSLVAYRSRHREELRQSLAREVRELAREVPRRDLADAVDLWARDLINVARQQIEGLERIVERVLRVATVLPVRSASFSRALKLEHDEDLAPRDAIILATVLEHCGHTPGAEGCFTSRDVKDLAEVASRLLPQRVRFIPTFRDAADYVRRRVERT